MISERAIAQWIELIQKNNSTIDPMKISKAFIEGLNAYRKNQNKWTNPYYVEYDEYLEKMDEKGILCSAFNSGISAGVIEKHPKEIIKFKETCNRCGYEFYPESEKLPISCPNKACRSPYWNKPRTKGV